MANYLSITKKAGGFIVFQFDGLQHLTIKSPGNRWSSSYSWEVLQQITNYFEYPESTEVKNPKIRVEKSSKEMKGTFFKVTGPFFTLNVDKFIGESCYITVDYQEGSLSPWSTRCDGNRIDLYFDPTVPPLEELPVSVREKVNVNPLHFRAKNLTLWSLSDD